MSSAVTSFCLDPFELLPVLDGLQFETGLYPVLNELITSYIERPPGTICDSCLSSMLADRGGFSLCGGEQVRR
jgi:hypothetical protein